MSGILEQGEALRRNVFIQQPTGISDDRINHRRSFAGPRNQVQNFTACVVVSVDCAVGND